jgi:hypothetical protein
MKKKLNNLHIVVPIAALFLSSVAHADHDNHHPDANRSPSSTASPAPVASSQPAQPDPSAPSVQAQAPNPEYAGLVNAIQAPASHDLSAQDLQNLGISMQASQDPKSHPNSSVSLNGMLFSACLAKFPISISQYTSADNSATGFEISENNDPQGGSLEGCQKFMRAQHATCNTADCTPVSSLPGAGIDLSSLGDLKVGLFHIDLNSDSADPVFENIGANEVDHLDAATIAQNKKDLAAQKRQALIDALSSQSTHCVKTEDQVTVATSACALLQTMEHVTDDNLSQILPQCAPDKLEHEALIALNADISKVKSTDADGMQAAQDEISQFASNYPDMADQASAAYLSLMNKYLTKPNPSAADLASAQALATNAANVGGVSDQQAAVVQSDQNQLQYQSLAQQGMSSNFSAINFFPAYQNLAQSAYQQVQGTCTGGGIGGQGGLGGMNSGCSSSISFFQKVSALPQQVVAQQTQQSQMQAQLNQQIMQAESSFGQQTSMIGGQVGGQLGGMSSGQFSGPLGGQLSTGLTQASNLGGSTAGLGGAFY